MLVNAQGADMDVHRNFKDEFGGSFFSSTDMPMGSVQDFMLRYGIAGRHVRLEEFASNPSIRFSCWALSAKATYERECCRRGM